MTTGTRGTRRLPLMGLCLVLVLSARAAPESLPGCVRAINDICQPGYYASQCDIGGVDILGCRPCPDGTFSDTPSNITHNKTCKPRKTCDAPQLTYSSTGNATSDTVCQCISGHLSSDGKCTTGGSSGKDPQAGKESGTASEGTKEEPQVAAWVGWVVVITVTASFIVLMLVFWFWTPCLRGEPDYGDQNGQGAYFKASPTETEKLVNTELTDDENAHAVNYAVHRLPHLIPLTPQYVQMFLAALLKTPSTELQKTEDDDNQSAETSRNRLMQGLASWQGDPGRPARLADLVEAMSVSGYGQKGALLAQEACDYVKKTGFLV